MYADIDDQTLNSFVDGLLDIASCESIFLAMEDDPVLRERIYRLRRIKDLMKLGFRDATPPPGARAKTNPSPLLRPTRVIAASVMALAISFGAGNLAHHCLSQPSGSHEHLAVASAAHQQADRVLLHVSSSDPERLEQALDDAELLLTSHGGSADKLQMRVVANAEGLESLLMDDSPYVERIRRMAQEYDNLDFFACSRTLEKLRMNGIEVHLIPEAGTIPGAFEEIIERLQEGWTYLRV